MEFELLLDNEQVTVCRWKIEAGEEVPPHRDEVRAIVTALQAGWNRN